mmetsp:Transcript_28203/g.46757  ORF Transcript_28203/g.46757 Transcript_28203/m.46757 type:complete len:213 (-) Transcript_28203:539-1177(-)
MATLPRVLALPARMFSKLVFPAPDGPMIAVVCCSGTSPQTSSSSFLSGSFLPLPFKTILTFRQRRVFPSRKANGSSLTANTELFLREYPLARRAVDMAAEGSSFNNTGLRSTSSLVSSSMSSSGCSFLVCFFFFFFFACPFSSSSTEVGSFWLFFFFMDFFFFTGFGSSSSSSWSTTSSCASSTPSTSKFFFDFFFLGVTVVVALLSLFSTS